MSKRCVRISEKYWIPNLTELLTHSSLFPSEQMSLGAKLNSVFRLTLVIFLVLLLMHCRFSLIFLALATLVNIGFYLRYRKEYEL